MIREEIAQLPEKLKEVRIPISLLTSEDRLPGLFDTLSEKVFDLYLVLLEKSEEANSYVLPIDYEELAETLHYIKPENKELTSAYAEHLYHPNISISINISSVIHNKFLIIGSESRIKFVASSPSQLLHASYKERFYYNEQHTLNLNQI